MTDIDLTNSVVKLCIERPNGIFHKLCFSVFLALDQEVSTKKTKRSKKKKTSPENETLEAG